MKVGEGRAGGGRARGQDEGQDGKQDDLEPMREPFHFLLERSAESGADLEKKNGYFHAGGAIIRFYIRTGQTYDRHVCGDYIVSWARIHAFFFFSYMYITVTQ